MKKLLIIPAALASFLAMASPASAHTPTITAECESLSIDLKWYEQGSTVTVTIDGVSTTETFGPNWDDEFTGQQSWSVVVDNNGPKQDKYDIERSGEFVDCTPATTTSMPTPTTSMPVPVETPFDVTVTMTRGFFGNDCDTNTAWIQFVNDGSKADRVSVGGHVVDVPAGGFARVNLTAIPGGFLAGPITSFVDDAPVYVTGLEGDGLGDVHPTCASSTVLNRQIVEQPQTLAFTGAKTAAMGFAGVLLFGFGLVLAAVGRKLS